MKSNIFSIVLAVAAAVPASVHADNIIDIEGAEATAIGIYIKELETGNVLVDHNSLQAMTPASVTKTVTSATALATLGPDYCFTTTVELEGSRSASARGRWNGNLVITASGDPTVGSDEFKVTQGFTDSIISGLKRLGINNIAGRIIVRESMPDAGPCPTWEVEDLAWAYGAGLHDFNYRGNTVRLYPNRGTSVPESELKPQICSSSAAGTDLLRGVGTDKVMIWTTDKNRRNKAWNVVTTVPDPAAVYKGVLTSGLKAAGINVAGKKYADSENSAEVYVNRSPSLKEICRSLMKRSDNLFAEGMLRALRPGESRGECIRYEKEFWTANGVPAQFTILKDGSGLTRANRLSPRFIADMLEWMVKSPLAGDYLDFFPVSGVDGTLKSFLAKTPLEGMLALKTGSVSAVQTYAGYKLDAEGAPTHVVVIMVNGFFCSRADLRKQLEQFLLDTFE